MSMRMNWPDRARRLSVLAVSGFAMTVILVACGGDDVRSVADRAAVEPTLPEAPRTGTASDSAATADLLAPATSATITTDTTGGYDRVDIATLLAARTSPPSAEGVERVVFEFDGDSVPRYEISYLEPPFVQCGSGNPIVVTGDAVLQVRLRLTRAHAETADRLLPTVTERDRKLGQPLLKQLILTCDFEGEVEWLLGLTSRIPFRILELKSPARLVVDLSPAQ